jgi:hypothetical protein
MATIWTIETLDRDIATGFVTTAHWTAMAIDGEYSASTYSTVSWIKNNPTIPYENLTEATVLNWVWETVDKAAIEASLAAQIELLKNPVTAIGTPWNI